eukprot:6401141-Pyramimonas_sp.AAC.1
MAVVVLEDDGDDPAAAFFFDFAAAFPSVEQDILHRFVCVFGLAELAPPLCPHTVPEKWVLCRYRWVEARRL